MRLLERLPKIASPTVDSWAAIKTSVSIFRVLLGSKYHFSWLISVVISSNFAPTFSPNSHTPNTVKNKPNNSLNMDAISMAFSLMPCCYKCKRKKTHHFQHSFLRVRGFTSLPFSFWPTTNRCIFQRWYMEIASTTSLPIISTNHQPICNGRNKNEFLILFKWKFKTSTV